jgi:hypothetical protein
VVVCRADSVVVPEYRGDIFAELLGDTVDNAAFVSIASVDKVIDVLQASSTTSTIGDDFIPIERRTAGG